MEESYMLMEENLSTYLDNLASFKIHSCRASSQDSYLRLTNLTDIEMNTTRACSESTIITTPDCFSGEDLSGFLLNQVSEGKNLTSLPGPRDVSHG